MFVRFHHLFPYCKGEKILFIKVTVETPYNTAPYITGSNIARLGHGSQNS